jgi:hypothetical protein
MATPKEMMEEARGRLYTQTATTQYYLSDPQSPVERTLLQNDLAMMQALICVIENIQGR